MEPEITPPVEPPEAPPGASTVPPAAEPPDAAIPVAKYRELEQRLETLSAEREAAAARLAELEAEANKRAEAEAEAKRKAAEEQGRFQELYAEEQAKLAALREELDTKTASLTAFEEREAKRLEQKREDNTARLGKLPESVQALAEGIPALSDDPDLMAGWLDKAEQMPSNPAPIGGGERNGNPRAAATTLTPQQADMARMLGFDPKTEATHFLTNIWPSLPGKAAPEA